MYEIIAGRGKSRWDFRLSIMIMLVSISLPIPGVIPPQSPLRFERLDFTGDRSLSAIHAIIQDSAGFMWFGCAEGLFRYDGYRLTHFPHQPGVPSSLSHDAVNALSLDRFGQLWIATEDGLNCFDHETETFRRFSDSSGETVRLSDKEINFLYHDRRGFLWAGTWDKGLNRLDITETRSPSPRIACAAFLHDPQQPDSLPDDQVSAVYEDQYGNFWVGGRNGMLALYRHESQTFINLSHWLRPRAGIKNHALLAILRDNRNWLWLGTRGGLYRLRLPPGKITSGDAAPLQTLFLQTPQPTGNIPGGSISTLHDNGDGYIWIGAYGEGVYRFHTQRETYEHYSHNPADPHSPGGDFITTFYRDRSGAIWAGAFNGGVFKYDPFRWKFPLFRAHHHRNWKNAANNIIALRQDQRGDIWIGSQGAGLFRHNPKTGAFEKCPPIPSPRFNPNIILSIAEDHDGKLWIGSEDHGLAVYDRRRLRFTEIYRRQPRNPNSLSNNTITALLPGEPGELWIGADDGLNRLNTRTKTFTRFLHRPGDPHSLSNTIVLSLHREPNNPEQGLWVGVYHGGLNILNIPAGTFTHYRSDPKKPNSLNDDNVRCIFKDRKGRFWIATDKGLNLFLPSTGSFIHPAPHPKLSSQIYGILEDHSGKLWLSTAAGLSVFDPVNNAIQSYDEKDGLQSNKFNNGAYMKSREGWLFFGGANGYNAFDPARIPMNLTPPALAVTSFQLFNEPLPINAKNGPLTRAISTTRNLNLNYRQNYLTFEFTTLDFTQPEKNRYAYRLTPLEKKWIPTDARKRFASYTHLPPGNYTFQVTGANSDGTWDTSDVSIAIHISPPFWRRAWFWILIVFIALAMLTLLFHIHTRSLRRKIDEQKKIRNLVERSRDELEKARRMAEWRDAENKKLIGAISAVFIAVDSQGVITQWNAAAQKFFGVTPAQALGESFAQTLAKLLPPSQLAEISTMGLHSHLASHNIEIHFTCPQNGEPRLGLASISPITHHNNETFGFILLAEDITHRQKLEMMQHLSQKLEALGQMAANIAHEIRSPLQYIDANCRFLQDSLNTLTHLRSQSPNPGDSDNDLDFILEEIPKAVEQMVSGVERVSAIVRSMYEFSHPGGAAENCVDLNLLLKNTLLVASGGLSAAADVETHFHPALPPLICNGGELNQVFLNLLSNAADAVTETGKRGKISITTRPAPDECIVEITDNGVGIPLENHTKIFSPFFTTKPVGKGTGQGLYLSSRIIINGYGGKIYFKSQMGEGTTFFIHLPLNRNLTDAPPFSAL